MLCYARAVHHLEELELGALAGLRVEDLEDVAWHSMCIA
jgi:hypothetical protein